MDLKHLVATLRPSIELMMVYVFNMGSAKKFNIATMHEALPSAVGQVKGTRAW